MILSALLLAFTVERPVTPGGPGPNRLAVDVPLLAGAASDLRDVRLQDGSGQDVPYLLIRPPRTEPAALSGKVLPILATKEESGFEVDLGKSDVVDQLEVRGLPAPYLKRFRLEGSGDRARWTVLVAEGTLFDLPDEKLRRVAADFTPGAYRYFRLTWNDRNSGRVPEPRDVRVRVPAPFVESRPLRAAADVKRLSSEPGKSRFRLRLPGAHLPLRALVLEIGKGNVLRTAEVTEPRLREGEVVPHALGSGILRRAERGGLVAEDLTIPIQAPEGAELDLIVDDGSNAALTLDAAFVEIAPQPFLYFESAAGEPLTARFGDPKLTAPRYDLESVRPYVGKSPLLEATWGTAKAAPRSSMAEATPALAAGAPIDRTAFRFARPFTVTASTLTALSLDAAVLAHSRDLGELRIVGAEGLQVPYLVERRDEPLEIPLAALVSAPVKDEKRTVYPITLPFGTLPAARLVFTTASRVFDRSVTLATERKADGRAVDRWETLATATWRNADPENGAPPLTFNLPANAGANLRLLVDEGDNSPLPLLAPRLFLPSYRLRFFASPGEKTLLYGQDGLAAPRYDLSLLAPRLAGAVAEEVTLTPEGEAKEAATKTPPETKVFWGVLVLAVVVLLGLLAKLVGKGTPV